MSWGRRNRLGRIFDPASGRTNMLAVDHGYFLGPITGMQAPRAAIGTEHERQTLAGLAALVDEAGRYDLPVLAVTAVGKELGTYDARYLGLATRICAELGADLVKTYYADGFEEVAAAAAVVHDGRGVDDAVGLYERLAGQPVPAGR